MANSNDNSDIYPSLSAPKDVVPMIVGASDMYLAGEVETGGQLVGILGLTYPKSGVLF